MNKLSKTSNMTIEAYEEVLMKYPDYVIHKHILSVVPPILLIVGTFGNVSSFFILMKKTDKKASTYCYLMVLAIMDSLVLYVGLFRLWLGQFMINIEEMTNVLCKLMKFLGYFCSDISVWLIVAVTIERAIVVLLPLKAQMICNTRSSRIFIIIVTVFFFLVNCHFLWSVDLKHYSFNSSVIISKCEARDGYSNLVDIIWPWVDATIYSFLPFIIILILNSLIIKSLISARKKRNSLRQHSLLLSRDSNQVSGGEINARITCMLLVISFVFLITTLPMTLVLIYTSFADDVLDDNTLARRMLVSTIAEMLMYLNHSINFFLYFVTGGIQLCRNNSADNTQKDASRIQNRQKLNTSEFHYSNNNHQSEQHVHL